MEKIGLASAIRALRTELGESMKEAEGEHLRFQVGEVELQFQVVVERSATGKGGIRFWVIEAGAEGTQGSATTHLIKIPLTPITSDNRPVVTGTDKLIPEQDAGQ